MRGMTSRVVVGVALSLFLGSMATTASAQGQGNNDSVDYEPRVQAVSGNLPLDKEYTLTVVSPTQLNKEGEEALARGIEATLRINVGSYPDASNPTEAAALVSLDDWQMIFHELGEKQDTTVNVHASAGTTPGDYVYVIQAVATDKGLGWGNSNHTLTVSVSDPVVVDTTPPSVVITAPTDQKAFTFCQGGTTVPVTILASDAESVVTAIGPTANSAPFTIQPFTPGNDVTANGTFLAPAVGPYQLEAWATNSVGLTGTSPIVGVSVNYTITWLSQLGRGSSIRFGAYDCAGTFVRDTSVRFELYEGDELKLNAVFGTGPGKVRIDDLSTHYLTVFNTQSGHTYTVKVFFNNYLQASQTFTVQ